MKIVIIGSGNVAYHLAKAFTQNNIEVSQIFGRNEVELNKISEELNIPYSTKDLDDAQAASRALVILYFQVSFSFAGRDLGSVTSSSLLI